MRSIDRAKYRKIGIYMDTGCHIGRHVFIDTLCGELKMGKNVWITSYAKILTHDGSDRFTGKKHKNLTIIKDGAFIGLGVIILTGLTIGKNAIIGAGAVVTKDVPDGEIWVGNPAKKIGDVKK